MRTDIGDVELAVPRDRAGTFNPAVIPKHSRPLRGFNDAVLSLYAKGRTTGDIANHLADIYGAEVSRDLVSRVTDAVLEQMGERQNRPLDPICPVLLIDVLKVRDGAVGHRPVYVAVGISVDGVRDVHGLWMGPSGGEGAKQRMNMLTELRNRGILDACIVCCDWPEGPARSDRRSVAGRDRANACAAGSIMSNLWCLGVAVVATPDEPVDGDEFG